MPLPQNLQRQVQNASRQTFCADPKDPKWLFPPSDGGELLDRRVDGCLVSSPGTCVRLLQNRRFQNCL